MKNKRTSRGELIVCPTVGVGISCDKNPLRTIIKKP